jgi:hypothetical protein
MGSKNLITATLVALAGLSSMAPLCAPQPTEEPTTQPDYSDTHRQQFKQTYDMLDPTIKDYFGKIEIEEAQYQDWNGRVNAKAKAKATYPVVEKQHAELVTRTTAAKAEYDAWTAYYEAHKETGTQEEHSKLSTDAQALQQTTLKIFSDYGQLKTTMMQIAPLHDA